MYNGHLDLK
jgi:hypothetical protein